VRLERSALPGIGLLQRFINSHGQRLGVVAHVTGRREFVIYHPSDADAAEQSIVLEAHEAHAVADLLATEVTSHHVAALERQVPGVDVVRLRIPAGSAFDGHLVPPDRARTAPVVAVIRDEEVIAAPGCDFVYRTGDEIIVAGTAQDTAALADLLAGH
jgi:TrkA domain protein